MTCLATIYHTELTPLRMLQHAVEEHICKRRNFCGRRPHWDKQSDGNDLFHFADIQDEVFFIVSAIAGHYVCSILGHVLSFLCSRLSLFRIVFHGCLAALLSLTNVCPVVFHNDDSGSACDGIKARLEHGNGDQKTLWYKAIRILHENN